VPKYTYQVTDLTDYDSEELEVILESGRAREFAVLVARQLVSDRPDLTHKGMCIAVYDEQGYPAVIVPLDQIQ
jgi:hypothetical protein